MVGVWIFHLWIDGYVRDDLCKRFLACTGRPAARDFEFERSGTIPQTIKKASELLVPKLFYITACAELPA